MPTLQNFDSVMKQVADEFNADCHHRLFSWDHAHKHWELFTADDRNDADLAALSLAFYLASFGMYRGSGDLFERDYKVLMPAVEFLRKESKNRWEDCLFSNTPPEELASKLKELSSKLSAQLTPKLARPGKSTEKIKASDTLLSKIMLVTLDCVPAFDQQTKKALKDILGDDYPTGNGFTGKRMHSIIQLARSNKPLIRNGQERIKLDCGRAYPLNRIFDLYLWYYGAPDGLRDQ